MMEIANRSMVAADDLGLAQPPPDHEWTGLSLTAP